MNKGRTVSVLHRLVPLFALALLSSCSSDSQTPDTGSGADTGTPSDAGTGDLGTSDSGGADTGAADLGGDAGAGQLAGLEFFSKMAGLWSGPATDTRLGTFPLKNMDMRAASDSVLFGRVDLDAGNNLRFAFAFEEHAGESVLVFRNGGFFMGILRDTRTLLVEVTGSTYRFCALNGGCDYVESTFEFTTDDTLEMRVLVRGAQHEIWTPTRVEARTLPAGFPAQTDLAPDAPFVTMPSASIRVSWNAAVAADTDVWAILSETSCFPSGACQFSRWIKTVAPAGATEATVQFDQIHAGSYAVLGLVDVDGNLATTRFPSRGDFISVPSPTTTVAPTGMSTADVTAGFTVP